MPAFSSIGSMSELSRLMIGPLVQAEAESVAELQTEGGHLVVEAELGRGGPRFGDQVGADAGTHEVDGLVHPLARLGVGVTLGRRGAAHGEGAVVTRAVAR